MQSLATSTISPSSRLANPVVSASKPIRCIAYADRVKVSRILRFLVYNLGCSFLRYSGYRRMVIFSRRSVFAQAPTEPAHMSRSSRSGPLF